MGAVHSGYVSQREANECLPQKQYGPEGTHGTPPGEKSVYKCWGIQ